MKYYLVTKKSYQNLILNIVQRMLQTMLLCRHFWEAIVQQDDVSSHNITEVDKVLVVFD